MENNEQFKKEYKETSDVLSRNIIATLDVLDDLAQTEVCGFANGWDYRFKKIEKTEKDQQ